MIPTLDWQLVLFYLCVCVRAWASVSVTLVDMNYLTWLSARENFIILGLVHYPSSFMFRTFFRILPSVTLKIFPYHRIMLFINLSSDRLILKFCLILLFHVLLSLVFCTFSWLQHYIVACILSVRILVLRSEHIFFSSVSLYSNAI